MLPHDKELYTIIQLYTTVELTEPLSINVYHSNRQDLQTAKRLAGIPKVSDWIHGRKIEVLVFF
jgi:hypothetical protein